MLLSGFYINLEKSTARDDRMRAQLNTFSLAEQYSRFPAVDGATLSELTSGLSAGQVGCFLSHFRLLQQNAGCGTHLHVMEDDVILSEHAAEMIGRLIMPGGEIQEYDVIFTDAHVGANIEVVSLYRKLVAMYFNWASGQRDGPASAKVLNISDQGFACTASYLVNKSSIEKICSFMNTEIAANLRIPVDLFFRFLANNGYLKVGVTVPFITTVPLALPSTIAAPNKLGNEDLAARASALIRRALFVDCDAAASLEEAALQTHSKWDGRDELIVAAVRLILSPDYVTN